MKRFCLLLALFAGIASLLSFCLPAFAQSDDEKNFLLMYFKEDELVVQSATRSPKPLSQTAENVTVVTARDIELMNAHSVADVLNAVTGAAVWLTGGPGQMANAYIQGSATRQVTVIIDGVVLNNLTDNTVDLGIIPVQDIEKIEIIKGPASSVWGSALGGVVNIITKSGEAGAHTLLSASHGTRNTDDFRAEARGSRNGVGYYLTAGRLQSDGLTPHFDVSENNAYAKLTYDLSDRTNVLFALGYEKTSRGTGLDALSDLSFENAMEVLHSTAALNSALTNDLQLNVSVRSLYQEFANTTFVLSTGEFLGEDKYTDKGYGASAKLTWKNPGQTIVFGADYDNKWLAWGGTTAGRQGIQKSAVYGNDTLVFGRLSVTPGVRYDYTTTNGDMTSPSLGIVYNIAGNTILRASAAKGFSIPTLFETLGDSVYYTANPGLQMETVWSYQAGVETTAVKYLWLKASAFRNNVRNAIELVGAAYPLTAENMGPERRQGLELALKTTPLYHASLTAGAEFIDARDLDTGQRLLNIPSRVYDLGLRYDDGQTFRALLQGRSIDWNADPSYNGKYNSFIFDLTAAKKVYEAAGASLEVFAEAHNIFDGSQYLIDSFKNPGRWYEGGVRCRF